MKYYSVADIVMSIIKSGESSLLKDLLLANFTVDARRDGNPMIFDTSRRRIGNPSIHNRLADTFKGINFRWYQKAFPKMRPELN